MKYIASPFIAFISLFGIHTASGQLAVISDQNINFSNAVSTISDGDWSSPSIWSGGVVPDASDDVVVIIQFISIFKEPILVILWICVEILR